MSEFIDLYDKERKFLNRVVDRTTYLFQPGEFMMYVLAVLENQDGKYLVTQRALNITRTALPTALTCAPR